MTTEQVIEAINDLLGQHEGSERELMEALSEKAFEWETRLQELKDEDDAS
jgi:hypothetical protein